jgi:hypothetical protein
MIVLGEKANLRFKNNKSLTKLRFIFFPKVRNSSG